MRDPFDSSMFVGQGAESVQGTLAHLEEHLPLMSDEDRDFVNGCKMTLEAGGVITAQNRRRLAEIAKRLNATGHDVLGGAVEPPLSMTKVMNDLANNIHTLTPAEKPFVNAIAGKMQRREQLTPREIERLMQIYTAKGF